jgi:hypothetical protein
MAVRMARKRRFAPGGIHYHVMMLRTVVHNIMLAGNLDTNRG